MLEAAVLLLAWAALPRLLPPRLRGEFADRLRSLAALDAPWCARVDLPLAGLLGVAVSLTAAFVIAPVHLNASVMAPDFGLYCYGVDALRHGTVEGFPSNQSVVAGALPGALSRFLGVLDGLVVGALFGVGGIAASLYLWGLALSGRVAGVCAALALLAVAPGVLLTRMATFYPEALALLAVSSATSALAFRYRSRSWLLLGGVGAGLAGLAALRGLFWVLPALAIVGAACRGPKLPARIGLLLLPVVLAFAGGRLAWPMDTPTLESVTENYLIDYANRARAEPLPATEPRDGYRWGWSNPVRIPQTVLRLADLRADAPALDAESVRDRENHIVPWFPVLVVALGVAVAGLRREPGRAAVLLVGLAPWALALFGATTAGFHIRFLAVAAPGMALLLGLAWSTVAGHRSSAALVLALLVLGLVPGWLSPRATWRVPANTESDPGETLGVLAGGLTPQPGRQARCVEALEEDRAAGLAPEGRIYAD